MLLGIRWITDVGGVNTFEYIEQLEIGAGDTQDVYFQLIDSSVDRAEEGYNPPGRRFMPPVNSTLLVELISTECHKRVLRGAVQPFTQDPSIWKLTVLGSDPLKGTVQMVFKLSQPGGLDLNLRTGKGTMLRIR